jgi:hypothetical protein
MKKKKKNTRGKRKRNIFSQTICFNHTPWSVIKFKWTSYLSCFLKSECKHIQLYGGCHENVTTKKIKPTRHMSFVGGTQRPEWYSNPDMLNQEKLGNRIREKVWAMTSSSGPGRGTCAVTVTWDTVSTAVTCFRSETWRQWCFKGTMTLACHRFRRWCHRAHALKKSDHCTCPSETPSVPSSIILLFYLLKKTLPRQLRSGTVSGWAVLRGTQNLLTQNLQDL